MWTWQRNASRRAAWVRLTFSLPADTDLGGPGVLASDPRFVRGTELWQLGLYDKARSRIRGLAEFRERQPRGYLPSCELFD